MLQQCHLNFGRYYSVRSGSFFADSHLNLTQQLQLIIYFVADCTATAASNILGISRQTVTAYFDKCRHAYQQALQKDPIQFEAGGEYEVDETLFRRVHNNQGELVDVQWVAGILERDSGKVLLYRVPNRSHESLLPPIRSHIPQGCFLYSDELTTYHMLDQEYMHYAVNHSNKEYV